MNLEPKRLQQPLSAMRHCAKRSDKHTNETVPEWIVHSGTRELLKRQGGARQRPLINEQV
jgi:hypothetical protein